MRSGLARFRPLTANQAEHQAQPTGLPTGWYYNEINQKTFWQDIESHKSTSFVPSQDEQDRKLQNFNDLSSSSRKIKEIVSKFDELDQDTLMSLLRIVDQDDNLGDLDQFDLMSEAKGNVAVSISDLQGVIDSQASLIESLKTWFSSAEARLLDQSDNISNTDTIPDPDVMYEFLAKTIREYSEKTERASFLHNDVNSYWGKHIAQLRQILAQRDSEIIKLKETIEAAQAARNRTAKKKQEKQNLEVELKKKEQQIEQQMRAIQEQKAQIDRLKSSLQSCEVSKAISEVHTDQPQPQIQLQERTEQSITDEAKITSLNQKIADLLSEMEKVRLALKSEREKNGTFQKKISEKEHSLEEMDILLQKYIKLASMEKPRVATPQEETKDDKLLQEMKFQSQLKEEQIRHQDELLQQAEVLRSKFQREKEVLLEAMATPNEQNLLKSIVNEYEKKFSSAQEEYQKQNKNVSSCWSGKLALLTHQYENQLEKMSAQNEAEIISLKDSVKYEAQKLELDVEEKGNSRVLQMKREKEKEISELQERNEKAADTIFNLQKQNELLRQEVEKSNPSSIALKDVIATPDKAIPNSIDSQAFEDYATKLSIFKKESEENHEWTMKQQAMFFRHQMQNAIEAQQKTLRNLLLNIQSENEKGEKGNITEAIANTFNTLNEKVENVEFDENEVVPLNEVEGRVAVLTERIMQLTKENKEIKGNEQKPTFEKEVEELRQKCSFLESLSKGDDAKAAENYKKMEEDLKEQIEFKDGLINEMQNALLGRVHPKYTIFTLEIVSREPMEIEEDEEEEVPQRVATIEEEGPIIPIKEDIEEGKEVEENKPMDEQQEVPNIDNTEPKIETTAENDKVEKVKGESKIERKDVGNADNLQENKAVPKVEKKADNVKKAENEPKNQSARKNESPRKGESPQKTEVAKANQTAKVVEQNKATESPRKTTTPQKAEVPKVVETVKKTESPVKGESPKRVVQNDKAEASQPKTEDKQSSRKEEQNIKAISEAKNGMIKQEILISEPKFDLAKIKSPTNPASLPVAISIALPSDPTSTRPTRKKKAIKVPKLYATAETQIKRTDFHFSIANGDSFGIFGAKSSIIVSEAVQQESHPASPIPKRKLYRSSLFQVHIPDNFVDPPQMEDKEQKFEAKSNFPNSTLIFQAQFSLAPAPKAPPIVVIPDEEQARRIEILQKQLVQLTTSKPVPGKQTASREEFRAEVSLAAIDYREKLLKNRYDEIHHLQDSKIVYQPKLVKIDINDRGTDQRTESPSNRSISPSQKLEMTIQKLHSIPHIPNQSPKEAETPQKNQSSPSQAVKTIQSDTFGPKQTAIELVKLQRREPIQFIMPKEENIDPDTISSDPFTQSIQFLASVMRFFAQLKDNEEYTKNVLNSDCVAYQTYLSTTGAANDSDITFLDHVTDVLTNIEKNFSQYETFAKMEKDLLNLQRQGKKASQIILKQNEELQASVAQSKITAQKDTLKDLSKQMERDPSLPQRTVLDKLSDSIQIIDGIGLQLTSDEISQLQKIKTSLTKLKTPDSALHSKKPIDALVVEFQSFISGLRAPQPKEDSEILPPVSKTELEELKKAYKRLKKKLDDSAQETLTQKGLNATIEDQNRNLQERIKQLTETQESTLSLYKTQLKILNDLRSVLGGSSSSTDDLATSVKSDVIHLQTLLDTTVSESKLAKAHAYDLEDQLNQRDKEIVNLSKQLNDALVKNDEIEAKLTKHKERIMDNEASIGQMKQEIGADEKLKVVQLENSEKVVVENKDLQQKIISIENELAKAKTEIRNMNETNDDLSVKLALGITEKTTRRDKSVQASIRIVRKRKSKSSDQLATEEKSEETIEETENGTQKVEVHDIKTEEEKSDDIPIKEIQATNSTHTVKEVIKPKIGPINVEAANKEEMNDIIEDVPEEYVEEDFEEEEDDSYADKIQQQKRISHKSKLISDAVAPHVPVPLDYKAHRPKTAIYSITSRSRSTMQKAKPKQPLIQLFQHSQPEDIAGLSLGGVSTQRSSQNAKVYLRFSQINRSLSGKKPLADLPAVTPMFSFHYEDAPSLRPISKHETKKEEAPPESVRITSVHFAEGSRTSRTAPNVSPIELVDAIDDPLNVSGAVIHQSPIPDVSEIEKIVAKLKSKLTEALDSNESQAKAILDLKAKLAEAMANSQRLKLENIRCEDQMKRYSIRYDNVSTRLNVAIGELSLRQEEIMALKRKVLELRRASLPAESTMRRVKDAQNEQMRIWKEEKDKKGYLADLQAAYSKESDEDMKKHLSTLLENTQNSYLRLEAKRRLWADIEKKQMMAALSAISLLQRDEAYDTVAKLPMLSSFRSMQKLKKPAGLAEEEETKRENGIIVEGKTN